MAVANAVGSSRMVGMISYPPKAESTYRELRNYVFWPKNASVNLSTISSCTFPLRFPILTETRCLRFVLCACARGGGRSL